MFPDEDILIAHRKERCITSRWPIDGNRRFICIGTELVTSKAKCRVRIREDSVDHIDIFSQLLWSYTEVGK